MTPDLSETYPAYLPTAPPRADEVLWMLDLDPDGNPVLAHQIIGADHASEQNETRTTACDQQATSITRAAWWSTKAGDYPLQKRWIHCGDARPVEDLL